MFFQGPNPQALSLLRDELVEVCAGTAFLVVGVAACTIAAIRRRAGVRVFLWLGIWSSAYGIQHLFGSAAFVASLPNWLRVAVPYLLTTLSYVLVIFGSFAWLDLIVGPVRRVVIAIMAAASVTAALGIGWFLVTGQRDKFMPLNNLLAACVLALLLTMLIRKSLFQKYLLLPKRGFLVFATILFAAEALYTNITRPLGFSIPILFDHLGFAIMLAAFGYSALRMVLDNEHRLLAIDSELAIARQIQSSILPIGVPQLDGVKIAATYQPAASVAGDFYEFLSTDKEHGGFFIADVCGHGVPAALIASMLKVAAQSSADRAQNPGDFLAELNRTLSEPLRGQLVSAAYLWIDVSLRVARYSAAGHPPLLLWRDGKLQAIESNGLLFGVLPECVYPVREVPLARGDRLLLYTDGITEPENARGEPFGDTQLARLLSPNDGIDISQRILSAISQWQNGAPQQDDMTLIVIDVL